MLELILLQATGKKISFPTMLKDWNLLLGKVWNLPEVFSEISGQKNDGYHSVKSILFFSNFDSVSLFTTILTGVSLALQGGFSKAFEFISNHEEVGFHLLAIMICSTISQVAIAFTIKNFGAVVFTILMIGRIIPQVLLSYFVYDAVFEVWGWIGIGIVFFGLILKLLLKCYQFYKNLKNKNAWLSIFYIVSVVL